jgi:XTP/dITP diphosphohydrolase/tetrapyrrole methylase family protein/MazG family protein/ATP diphosphatase
VQERSEGQLQHGREPVEPAEPAGTAGTAGTGPAAREVASALAALDEITRRLRRDCPWDREQDERSIVPHTVEEAYELADAAHSGDDAKLLDELGDVLFQVYFLALLLEERGQGDLARVADHVREKLIRRHPHVFGRAEAAGSAGGAPTRSVDADTSDEVLRNWNQIKRDDERGGAIFGDIPDNLPSTLYAKKVLKRAESAGFVLDLAAEDPGERLLAAVRQALDAGVDPELALRRAADRFKDEVDGA